MIKNITEEFFGRCDTYLKSLNCYSRHIRHADSEPSKIKCCLLTHYMHCFYKAVLQKNEKTAFICNQKGLFPEQESILVNKIKSKPFNCPETKFIGLKKTIDWAYFYRKYRFLIVDKPGLKVALKSSIPERDDIGVDMLKYSEWKILWFKHIWKSLSVKIKLLFMKFNY